MYLTGEFRGVASTVAAIRELKANGFGPGDLDVFSQEPLEFPRGMLDRPSRMSLTVVLGAIVVGLLTVSFVYFTQYNYPLITGGMPLFSFWATGVVFYELTMLGAIVTTLCYFLWESGLLRRGKRAPVPSMQPGVICVRVHCLPKRVTEATAFLTRSGAIAIQESGEPA
jgi:hypothetical protein